MAFRRKIKPMGALAEFLKTTQAMTPETFTKRLWDRLYATGSVRHSSGLIRAHRSPKRIRVARKQGKRPILL